jgi:catechol 2,3-dioxygenase-like lactoylglutathione lyase family enzyme
VSSLKRPLSNLTGFNKGEDYIIYYQLAHGQFIEIFPESSILSWKEYDGNNHDEWYSYQNTSLESAPFTEMKNPENNTWQIGKEKNYISKVTYHVRNLQKSMDFYSKIYEMDVKQTSVTSGLVRVNEDQEIELIEHNYPKDNCTNNKGQYHYALIVKDIVAFAQDMKEKGIQIWYGPKAMTKPYTTDYIPVHHSEQTYNLYIQDPDDNDIEVMQYSEDSYQVKYAAKDK